ncbi:MAG: leucine-rich repeat protein [Oscillospiraceae bacterium]|jgi:hypothetical protein|nr:leucine-rich repeat protein [Oscillospiraceae bacterium]
MKKRLCVICAALLILAAMPAASAAPADFRVDNGTLLAYTGSDSTVEIPSGVYYIADDVFAGKTFIKNVVFPDTVISIGRRAFMGTGLTAVTIPRRVTYIATDAFSGCASLSNVVLNAYLTSIGAGAFENCPITSIDIPYGVKYIGLNAFKGTKLTSVTIPGSVTQIGDFAFDGGVRISGVAGTRAESFSKTFNLSFSAVTDLRTPPPPLPNLSLPPKKLRDTASDLPRYKGPGAPPADYAVQAVNYLYLNTDIEDAYYRDFSKGVSREEIAYYLVHMYYSLKGQPLDLGANGAQVFSDTDNPYVTKARELGLMTGTNTPLNLFSPSALLTRQEMAVLLIKLLDKCGIRYNTGSTSHIVFSDQSSIDAWAADAVRRAYFLGLISGTGGSNISPQVTLSRESVFTMLWNVFTGRSRIENMFTRDVSMGTPQLVYSGVGRRSDGYIEEAYYAAPAVADIDKDGKMEIIYSSWSVYCVDAATGAVKWQAPSGYDSGAPKGTQPVGNCYADIIVTDIDGDGELEIVAGHSVRYNLPQTQWSGILAVYDKNGRFKPGWPQKLPRTVNSVAVADLNGNGKKEIVAGTAGESSESVWVYDCGGNKMSGWPQLTPNTDASKNTDVTLGSTGFQYGMLNNNLAIGDINNDGKPEIIAPTDYRCINAYDWLGNLIRANPIFDRHNMQLGGTYSPRSWGKIGVYVSYEYEKMAFNEGLGNTYIHQDGEYADIGRQYATFTHNQAVISDVDGNGTNEVVIIGTVHDKTLQWPELPLYETPFIFNGDRSRFKTEKYDWTAVPTDTGPILTTDYTEIQLCRPVPVVADVNNDGVNEILYPSGGGKIMCYSLNREFEWSYWVCDGTTIEFASPLTVMDITGDGFKEIVFTTVTANSGKKTGSLVILDWKGNERAKVTLPPSFDPVTPNGSVARPVVMDIDGDGKLEIVVNTRYSGLTVYRLP